MRGAKDRGLPLAEADAFEAVSGGGIRARVEGREVLVGSRRFLSEAGVSEDGLLRGLRSWRGKARPRSSSRWTASQRVSWR